MTTLKTALWLAVVLAGAVRLASAAQTQPLSVSVDIPLSKGEKATVVDITPLQDQDASHEVTVHRLLAQPRKIAGVVGTASIWAVYQVRCGSEEWSIVEMVLLPDKTLDGPPLGELDLTGTKLAHKPLKEDRIAYGAYMAACERIGPSQQTRPTQPIKTPQTLETADLNSPPPASPVDVSVPPVGVSVPPVGVPATPIGTIAGPAVSSSTPASQDRPFPDAQWTLGVLAGLAHHVYADPFTREARIAALRVLEGQWRQMPGRGPDEIRLVDVPRRIVKFGIEDGREQVARDATAASEKAAFLHLHGLQNVAPPALEQLLASGRDYDLTEGFRAEFYRHAQGEDTVVVFRGSAEATDWLNNAWLGVDFDGRDAPYYQHALEIVKAFQKLRPGSRPILVGHSLGGGLAQYVGRQLNLRAVAFNSSPLPERYLLAADAHTAQLKIYSAVYIKPSTNAILADPVSLKGPGWARNLRLKATHHTNKPVCLQPVPNPYLTDAESARIDKHVYAAWSTPSVFSKLGLANLAVGYLPHAAVAEQLGGDPAWKAVEPGVQKAGRGMLRAGAKKLYGYQSGVISAGEAFRQVVKGKWLGLATNATQKTANILVRVWVTDQIHAHSMHRFFRGMDGTSLRQSFDKLTRVQKGFVAEQCATMDFVTPTRTDRPNDPTS